jgi:hypothetical protein
MGLWGQIVTPKTGCLSVLPLGRGLAQGKDRAEGWGEAIWTAEEIAGGWPGRQDLGAWGQESVPQPTFCQRSQLLKP